MTANGERPLDNRLVEITHFKGHEYNQEADVGLALPVLPTYSMFPGDYRSQEQIEREAAATGTGPA